MSEPKTLTVVTVEDWAILFRDEDCIDQGHSIDLWQIEKAANGEPIKIVTVSAYDSPFDKEISEAGDFDARKKLSEIMPLTKHKR